MPNIRNEAGVKRVVKAVLQDTHNCWFYMPAANGFGRPGIPDFIGAVNGRAFGIETKFGDNTLSAHQLNEINNMVSLNIRVWVVRETTLREFEAEFKGWAALWS